MAMHDARMFTVKEINRLKILQDVIDRNLSPGQAAEMLGITPRHCSRLLKRYRQSWPLGMNNQSRGRTGNRQLPASLTELALNITVYEFMADYNRRFAKAPRHNFDVHRPLETDDDLVAFFTWREPRRVSKSLTVQYDKVLYLIEDNELSRRAIGKYIDVWHYPDGRKELRLNGGVLPYSTYDRLQEIDQGAIVDNKGSAWISKIIVR